MPKLPRLTARQVAARLEACKFSLSHQRGSHRFYRNAVGRLVTVPFHGSRIICPKTLKDIMRQAGIAEW